METSTNPSPKVILHGFVHVTMKVLNSYHLSKDKYTAVKVGKRHGDPVLYIVKAGEMYRDGYQFYLSKNGVWLTKQVPVKYLEKNEQ